MNTLAHRITIDHMRPSHRVSIEQIESLSHERPWNWEDFMDIANKSTDQWLLSSTWINVALIGEDVVGYIVIQRNRKTHITEVVNMGVTPNLRRFGIGRRLVDCAVEIFSMFGDDLDCVENVVQAEVRERNLDAQLFFRDCKFLAIKVLHNQYEETDEDTYLFELRE